jgi:hypothetical protein
MSKIHFTPVHPGEVLQDELDVFIAQDLKIYPPEAD